MTTSPTTPEEWAQNFIEQYKGAENIFDLIFLPANLVETIQKIQRQARKAALEEAASILEKRYLENIAVPAGWNSNVSAFLHALETSYAREIRALLEQPHDST